MITAEHQRVLDHGLRVVVATMLLVSGLIHFDLAHFYPVGKGISQEHAFKVQGVVVLLVALAVLVLPVQRSLVWAAALLVAAGSFVALLLAVYWHSAGTLPGIIYDGGWASPNGKSYVGLSEKRLAAVVEATAAVGALVALTVTSRRRTGD